MDDDHPIRTAHAAWIAAVNAGDLAWLLDAMTADVVFINPGQAPFGREQFPTGFNAGHAQYRLTCRSDLEEVVVAGDQVTSASAHIRGQACSSIRSGGHTSVHRLPSAPRMCAACAALNSAGVGSKP